MRDNSKTPSLDDPRLQIGDFLKHDAERGVEGLFANRRVSYSFNTRVAIRKACDVLDLQIGDEILVPDYNCGSEIDPLLHAGLKPTFYPISRQSTAEPNEIEKRITSKTKAVYLTHYFGFLQPYREQIRKLCDRYELFLIEDCALSLLSGENPIDGRLGDISVFCFYKFFPVLGGGALVINNDKIKSDCSFDQSPPPAFIAKQILKLAANSILGQDLSRQLQDKIKRQNSISAPELIEYPNIPSHYYFDARFQNNRISRFASLPLRSHNIKENILIRRNNYQTYMDLLTDIPNVSPLFPTLNNYDCPLNLPIVVKHRNSLAKALNAAGIPVNSWWSGYHEHFDWANQKNARFLKESIITLPLHQSICGSDISYITSQLRELTRN